MRTTLSQPLSTPPTTPRRRVTTFCRLALALAILSAQTLGCNRVDTEGESAHVAGTETSPSNTTTAGEDESAGTNFEWPSDAPHPRLIVEIDDGTIEGTIEIEMMPELAPLTVMKIAELAMNGYYDGTTFHRVIPGFMIQGGDPNSRDRDPSNDGYGDGDLRMDEEFSGAPFLRGVVGIGNEGRAGSSGGQLFIMHADETSLDGRYTVIGRVISGMDIVDAIARVETDRSGRWGPKDRPIENVVMKRARLAEAITRAIPQGIGSENSAD